MTLFCNHLEKIRSLAIPPNLTTFQRKGYYFEMILKKSLFEHIS